MIKEKLKEIVKNNEAKMIEFRRELHKYPELSMKEFETTKRIAKKLEEIGIPYRLANPTGIIAEIKGKEDGKTVLLRGDIDGLPVRETNDIDYKSVNEGISHACGHDTHTSMLLNAASALYQIRDKLKGNVKLVFQPGEETGEGSIAMVEDGVLDNVDNAFGIHIFTSFDTGTIGATTGQTFAANNFLKIKFIGHTTHGSTPQKGVDAMVMAASFVMNVQNIISREVDLLEDPVVLTLGKINGGEVSNSVCNEVLIEGGFRSFTTESTEFVKKRIKEMAEDTAKTFRGDVNVEFIHGAYPVYIDENSGNLTRKVAAEIVGEENVLKDIRFAGSEDFGTYLTGYKNIKGVPGSFGMIGARNENPKTHNFNHSSDFFIDEKAMINGALLYALYAYEYLKQEEF